MPVFEYTAFKGSETVTGILNADTPREARDRLRAQGLHVTAVEEVKQKGGSLSWLRLPRFASRAQLQEIALFTRQFATLLNSGLPLTDALSALVEQSENRKLESTLRDVRERVTQGTSLGEAMSDHPHYFSTLYVSMVRAGEESGTLGTVLNRLADFTQNQYRLQSRVGAALAYPIFLLVVSIGVVIFLMAVVVPKIAEMLKRDGGKLPLPTQILMNVSDLVKGYWWVLLIVIFGTIIAIKLIYRTTRGKLFLDTMMLRLPLMGMLFRKQAVSRFAATFASLLGSGIPALECLRIVRDVVSNQLLANTIGDMRTRVMEGTDIATPMRNSRVFPPLVAYMVAIGEESGELQTILDQIAEAYDDEVEIASQKITSLLEPIIILCMAGVVAFIVLSILYPILKMSKFG